MSHRTEAREFFRAKGFAHRMGWGNDPAVLVVDFACVWTDPASPLGADFSREIGETRRILDAARQARVAVFCVPVTASAVNKPTSLHLAGAVFAQSL